MPTVRQNLRLSTGKILISFRSLGLNIDLQGNRILPSIIRHVLRSRVCRKYYTLQSVHTVRVRRSVILTQKGKTFFATVSANLTTDKIVSFNKRYPVEGDGIYQEVRYLNESEPVYSVNSFYHLGRSLKDKTYNIMYMGSVNYNKNVAYIAE